jgi:TolB-like protein
VSSPPDEPFAASSNGSLSTVGTVRPPDRPSIAVLPFVNLRSEPSSDFFSDGLTEELINLLSRTEGLRVVTRTSVFQFKDKALDVRRIAQLRCRSRAGSAGRCPA